MSESLQPPFVIVEGDDVTLFGTLAELLGWVEAVDVRDHAYDCFDGSGRRVLLAAASDRARVTVDGVRSADNQLRDRLVAIADRNPDAYGIVPERAGLGDVLRGWWDRSHAGVPFPRDIG